MSLISFSPLQDGITGVNAAATNTPLSTIYNDYNGNITDANVSASAAIAFSKISGGSATALVAAQSWTPTWTNLTVGNATQSCKYLQIGKWVYFRVSLVLGSTSSVGTTPTFTLPVTSVSMSNLTIIGHSSLIDAGTGPVQGFVVWASTTTAWPSAITTTYYTGLTASNPFIWSGANGDQILCTGMYEAA